MKTDIEFISRSPYVDKPSPAKGTGQAAPVSAFADLVGRLWPWPLVGKQDAEAAAMHKSTTLAVNLLAYLSLLIFCSGWLLKPNGRFDEAMRGPLVATMVAFVLSRAAILIRGATPLTRVQKWLLYPSLLALYAPLAATALLGPAALAAGVLLKSIDQFHAVRQDLRGDVAFYNNKINSFNEELRQFRTPGNGGRTNEEIQKDWSEHVRRREAVMCELGEYPAEPTLRGVALTRVTTFYGAVAAAGATWFVLGLFAWLFPSAVRAVFYPFAAKVSWRMGFAMSMLGIVMTLIGLIVFR